MRDVFKPKFVKHPYFQSQRAEIYRQRVRQLLAIDQNADTISTSRSIAMLAAITGNIDAPGGNVFPMKTGIPSRATRGKSVQWTRYHFQVYLEKRHDLVFHHDVLLDNILSHVYLWFHVLVRGSLDHEIKGSVF
jgi:hypothetical protein